VQAGVPTHRYEFRHAIKFIEPNLGAFHASELFFVFDNTYGVVNLQAQGEATLAQEMMGYWGAMATAGDPNGGGRLSWPAYDATSEKQMVLDLTLSTESAYEKSQCDFWDGIE
jgi:para-nitrobenzyl esterase